MDLFNRIITALFDVLLYPFGTLEPVWGLVLVSVVTGAAMVWIFGRISNQQRVRTLKAAMKGHLLEVWIFREQLRNVLKAEGRVLRDTGKYLLCSLPAFVVLMIPVVVIMIHLQARYGCRPLLAGEHALVKVFLAEPFAENSADVKLQVPEGLVLETPALRIPRCREVDFRVGAARPGRYQLDVEVPGETVTKSVEVGPSCGPLSSLRSNRPFDRLLNPAEAGLPSGPIAAVEIAYPSETVSLGGFRCHWLWPFLILSLAAGYALKGVFRVEL